MYKFVVPLSESAQVQVETGVKFSKVDEREFMLQWLEVKKNFTAVYGRQRTVVGSKPETAKSAWARATKYLNEKIGLSLTTESVVARFRRYKDTYFETVIWSKSTGAGITEHDSVSSIDELLEKKCYGYVRMEALFKNSPHLFPSCEASTGKRQLKFKARAKSYTVRSQDISGDGDNDRDQVSKDSEEESEREDEEERGEEEGGEEEAGGEAGEEEEGEEEVNGGRSGVGTSQQFIGNAFEAYRSKGSEISSNSRSTSSKKRPSQVQLASPNGKGSSKNVNTRKSFPESLSCIQPLSGNAKSSTQNMAQIFAAKYNGESNLIVFFLHTLF